MDELEFTGAILTFRTTVMEIMLNYLPLYLYARREAEFGTYRIQRNLLYLILLEYVIKPTDKITFRKEFHIPFEVFI